MSMDESLLTGESVLTAAEGASGSGPSPPGRLASGALRAVLENKLSALLGADNLSSVAFVAVDTPAASTWTAPPPNGTGSYRTVEDNPSDEADGPGGSWEESTGGGSGALRTNNALIQTTSFVGRAPVLAYNNPSRKCGGAWVGRIVTPPDPEIFFNAGTIASDATPGTIQYPCVGPISGTNFALAIGANQGASIVSTIAIDDLEHTALWWMDGTRFFFQVDNETPQGISAIGVYPLNGGALHSSPVVVADKYGTGESTQVRTWQTRLALWMCSVA